MIFYLNKKRKRNYEFNRVLKIYIGWKRNFFKLFKKISNIDFIVYFFYFKGMFCYLFRLKSLFLIKLRV